MQQPLLLRLMRALLVTILCYGTPVSADTTIGVIVPMSGNFARYGATVRAGLQSVTIPQARLVYEDEGCHPTTALTAYKKLTTVHATALLLGPSCGSPQMVVASELAKTSQLAILGSSAPERVFEISKGKMFSTQHSIEQESAFNAAQSYRLGARKVVIMFFENDFSRAHEAAYRQNFKGSVLETLTYNSPDGSALRALIPLIVRLSPDSVYVPDAFPIMHGLLRELHNAGLTHIKVFSVYSVQSDDLLVAMGDHMNGMIYSYPKIEGEALQHFPRLAAQVLASGLADCSSSPKERIAECVRQAIQKKYAFNAHGVLEGELALKTVSQKRYSWFKE